MEKKVFEFTNYDVPVVIAGQEYTLNCSADTGDYLQSVGKELKKLSAEMSSGTKTKDDVVAYGMGIVDKLLGAGTAEQVLGGCEHKLSDVMDLCLFLTKTAAAFKAEHRKIQDGHGNHRPNKKKQRNG